VRSVWHAGVEIAATDARLAPAVVAGHRSPEIGAEHRDYRLEKRIAAGLLNAALVGEILARLGSTQGGAQLHAGSQAMAGAELGNAERGVLAAIVVATPVARDP
jgi:hypothetical protein